MKLEVDILILVFPLNCACEELVFVLSDVGWCFLVLAGVSLVLNLTLSWYLSQDFIILFEYLFKEGMDGVVISSVALPSFLSIPYVKRILLEGGPRHSVLSPHSSITSSDVSDSL